MLRERRPGTRGLPLAARLFAVAGVLLVAAPRISAQTISLTGTILDAGSNQPVIGAQVSINDRGATASTNAEGRFGLSGVPVGPQRVVIRRFGYKTFDGTIDIAQGMREPVILLQPDPVQLQELSVNTNTKAHITGVVVDATTGLPIPYVGLKLTTDGRKQVGRVADADGKGAFRIQDIPLGGYLLYVQRLGYAGQFVPIVHRLPAEPLEIRLDPNVAILEGITVLAERQDSRRKAFAYEARVFDEDMLRAATSTGMREFFDRDANIAVIACPPIPYGRTRNCIEYPRAETDYAVVYVDELRLGEPGLQGLFDGFGPKAFYKLETYLCPRKGVEPPPPMGRAPPPEPSLELNYRRHLEVRAYTYEYMERTAGRPTALIPPCT